MDTHRSHLKSEEDDVYAKIKSRLGDLASKNTTNILYSPRNHVPGPGHYSITLETNRSHAHKFSFPNAPRFHEHSLSSRNLLDNSDSTIHKSMSTRSLHIDNLAGEPINGNSLPSERSVNYSKLSFMTQEKQNSKSQSYLLKGSFAKAPRIFDNSLESPSLGPGTYNPVLTPTSGAISFGRKLNPIDSGITYPGPGTYRPEDCKADSKHEGNRAAVILKGEKGPLIEVSKDLPQGQRYYFYSNFSSFETTKAKGPSLGFGKKEDFVLRSQRDFPGPGAYIITDPSELSSSREQIKTEFPSLGRPNDIRHFKEYVPGPGEYDVAPVLTSPAAKIGTSKRPGHFDPKREVEVVFSEEKMKRLRRLEKRLAELAVIAEKKAESSRIRPQIKKRMLLFEELAKSNLSPGFIYNIGEYNKIGKKSVGGKFGTGNKDYLSKQIKDKMSMPGPAAYDFSKAEAKKQFSNENTFGTSKRQDIFVKKDAENTPGVGNYETVVEKIKKGGVFTRAKKGLNDSRTEELWEQTQQVNEKKQDFYSFMEDLDTHLKQLIKKTDGTDE